MQHPLPKTLTGFFWFFIKKQKRLFILMQVLAFAWSIDNTLWPYVLRTLINTITDLDPYHDRIWHTLTPLLIFWVIAWLAIDLAFRINSFMAATVFPKFEAQIRMGLLNYTMDHSYTYFANHFAGNLSNRISDMTQSATRVMRAIIYLFLPVTIALIITTVIFYRISPYFALLLTTWASLHIGICLVSAGKCANLSKTHANARSFLTGKIVDTLTNIVTVMLFARRPMEQQYIGYYQQDEKAKSRASLMIVAKIEVLLSISSFLFPNVLLTWYLIHGWQQGFVNVGTIVLIFNTTWNMQHLIWFAGMQLPELYKEIGVCQQALSLIQADHTIKDSPNAEPLSIRGGEIRFDHVNFAYNKTLPVFDDLNVIITAGSKVGLVGFSGGGKSTFVNLILRFFDINQGKITIDGNSITDLNLASLRSQISMIPQDPSLFHRSLHENIGYGKPDASTDEIINAAKQAHCHDFITALPQGYDTLVGERGIKLSGGQRQRIAIARAILKDAPILIMDEATSALDSVTEQHIQRALHDLMQQRTTLVIAHRLSTLAQMDRILVFDNGQIIEDGHHQQLIEAQGHYANMWAMQSRGFLPDKIDG